MDAAVDFYLSEAGVHIATKFGDALADTLLDIQAYPGSGSPHHGHALGLDGLRMRRVGGFPYLVFYTENEGQIDVWRVLHGARDIPANLSGDDSTDGA